jgi:hypothetical protein
MTSTKARSNARKSSANGTGSSSTNTGSTRVTPPPPTGEEFYEKVQAFAEGTQDPTTTQADDPTVETPPVTDESPNREERRKQERQAKADEKEQLWAEMEDEAREALAIARDAKDEAQVEYDKVHARAKSLREQLNNSGPIKGFRDLGKFIRTQAGFGKDSDYHSYMAQEAARDVVEAELVVAEYEEEKARMALSRASKQHRIAKMMSAKFRMKYRNEAGHGYYRAVSRINMFDKWVKAPLRWLRDTGALVVGAVISAVATVVTAIGVVAAGAVALGATVVGFFTRGLRGMKKKDPQTA